MQLKVIEQREQIEKLLEKHDIRFVEVGEKDIHLFPFLSF